MNAGSGQYTPTRPTHAPLRLPIGPPPTSNHPITVEIAYLAARVRLLRDAVELSHMYRRAVPHPARTVA